MGCHVSLSHQREKERGNGLFGREGNVDHDDSSESNEGAMKKFSFVLVFIVGCVQSTVFVPKTAEGMACIRECLHMENECSISGHGFIHRAQCSDQHQSCLETCPGAKVE